MTPDAILVSRSPGETRYALLADEAVIEVVHRRDGDIHPGAVVAGRVVARVPGVNAVFVDVGGDLPGVMAAKAPFPHDGAVVTARVVVPPRAGKGAELKRADGAALETAPDQAALWWAQYRDTIEHVICEPAAEAWRLRLLMDGAPVAAHKRAAPLFPHYGVDDAIERALQPDVALPGGGRLTIETTAAVTAVDVDSGAGAPETANVEAVAALARELRLRNMAGHVVVDIIPVGRKAALARALRDAVADDPVETQVAGLTPLGMIELTRKRVGLSLAETLCDGGGLSAASVAYDALRLAVRDVMSTKRSSVTLAVSAEVARVLKNRLRRALAEATDATKCEITVEARGDFPRGRIEIVSS